MNGPKQEPYNGEMSEWEDWQDYHPQDKSHSFPNYDDSTRGHIDEGESQKFHYEGNDLPEKE